MLFSIRPASAQDVEGRISFGFDVGGNKYWGNFTDNHFGFSGDLFIRWNIEEWLSLHLLYSAGLLRYNSSLLDPPVTSGVNTTRHSGWELAASYNVFPEETFVPYVMAGIEALNFEPKDAGNHNLPNNAQGANYSKNVIGGILGLGFEMFITDKAVFNGKVLLHLTGTDWLDDYSDPKNFRQDVYLTFGLGFSYYIFAPPVASSKTTEVVTPPATTTNITNVYNTNIIKGDTVVVTQTDTVYRTKILKGTVYNFPGTLFIVNTDEFNTNMPGNMQNLQNIKTLVNQCPELKVEIQGHASHEGTVARNQELSDMRAAKIKRWLIDQGVDPGKIVGTVGLGTSDDAVYEPVNSTAAQLEAARILNRRISVRVMEGCH
jgi:outer membrane protein OmpA-like peptidoglycan-associated protein